MSESLHHRPGSASPAHIVISTTRSPSPKHDQRSPQLQCLPGAKQNLHRHHAAAAPPITATGIQTTRAPALMPAPDSSHHLFRPVHTITTSLQSPTDRNMTSTMLPQPAQPQQAAPIANGPISRPVMVPARAKPGRKAMDNSEKEDRRRKQNRNAQRNYRDRRSQQVAELTDEVNDLKQHNRETINQHLQEMQRYANEQQRLQAEIQKMREDTQRWIDKANHYERAFSQLVSNLPRDERERMRDLPPPQQQHNAQIMRAQAPLPDFSTIALPPLSAEEKMTDEAMPPTPPEDTPDETDFTQIWLQNRGVPQQHDPVSNDDLTMSCGFCADSDYCPCKEAASEPVPVLVQTPVKTTTGPGTCDMCQRDPARAEACRSLAGRTQPSKSPPTAQADKTMNCGQFIDRAGQHLGRMPSIAELLGPLHSYPAAKGFDVNEQEAAVVLQRMATQPSP